jgi:hypothetical protein
MWAPQSIIIDTYLWRMLKEKVYLNNPHSLEKIQRNTRLEISADPIQQLQQVSKTIFS